jgi:hypothetical protein
MSNQLTATLFPSPAREFRGQRWVNIALRCLHLVGVAGIAGGFMFGLDRESWLSYWYLTLASGIALTLIYIWCSAVWLLELKGMVIILKNLLLTLGLFVPEIRPEAFIAIIVMSGLIAHAPARVRSRRWLRPLRGPSKDPTPGRR